jgi:hypothetical protein
MKNDQASDSAASAYDVIEVRLRDVRQLFDAMDPSPFREKDLAPRTEEFIVESLKDLSPREPKALVIHLDRPTGFPEEDQRVGDAVRVHFARKASLSLRDLRRLRRRGLLSLAIGAAFLAVVFGLSQVLGRFAGDGATGRLFREGLVIVGWVAMWRPLEIFLYDWWPILGEKRIYDRLSRIAVRIVPAWSADTHRIAELLAEGQAQTPLAELDSWAAARAVSRWENEGGSLAPKEHSHGAQGENAD